MFYELKDKIESPLEERFLEDCVSSGLRVIPQYKVDRYRIDFALPDFMIGLECDGKEWHSSFNQIKRDKKRDQVLESKGWIILRFRGSFLYKNGEKIASKIKQFSTREEVDIDNLIDELNNNLIDEY